MIVRLLAGGVVGVVMTLLLFGFMLKLVSSDQSQQLLTEAVTQMKFVELPEEPPPEPESDSEAPALQESLEPMQTHELVPVVSAPVQSRVEPVMESAPEPSLQDLAPAYSRSAVQSYRDGVRERF